MAEWYLFLNLVVHDIRCPFPLSGHLPNTQVQTIDEHITATAERVKDGARELVKAERSQRSTQNKCLWLWLIAAGIVSVVIILVFA